MTLVAPEAITPWRHTLGKNTELVEGGPLSLVRPTAASTPAP